MQPISANVSVNLMPEPPAVDDDIPSVDVSTSSASAQAAGATAAPEVSEENKAEAEKLKTEGKIYN